jgi:hypothetical protein
MRQISSAIRVCTYRHQDAEPCHIKLVPDSSSDLIEPFLPTGDIPIWLVEDIPSDEQVAVALDAIRAIWPDLAMQLRERFEILDEAFDRESLDRLAIAITRLAQELHIEPLQTEWSHA